jgi:hypothetical protein
MTPWTPPTGLEPFVRLLQRCGTADAVRLLARAFETCAADAILQDYRLRGAAPQLLAACKAALATADTGTALDWHRLTAAIEQAELATPYAGADHVPIPHH